MVPADRTVIDNDICMKKLITLKLETIISSFQTKKERGKDEGFDA